MPFQSLCSNTIIPLCLFQGIFLLLCAVWTDPQLIFLVGTQSGIRKWLPSLNDGGGNFPCRTQQANSPVVPRVKLVLFLVYRGDDGFAPIIREHFCFQIVLLSGCRISTPISSVALRWYLWNYWQDFDCYITPHSSLSIWVQSVLHLPCSWLLIRGGFKTQPPVKRRFRPVLGGCNCLEQ